METAQKNIKKKNSSTNFSNTKIGLRTKNLSFFKNQKQKPLKDNIQAGDVLNVKITALGSKNIGVAELKNGYTVLVPNTKCGERVQVKVEKMLNAFGRRGTGKRSSSVPNQKIKYIVASLNEDSSTPTNTDKTTKPTQNLKSSTKFDLKVGQKLKVTIAKKGPKNSGLIPISKNFLLIVPNAKVGEKLCVEIQKIKQNYAFAKTIVFSGENGASSQNAKGDNKISSKLQTKGLGLAQQFHVVIPSTAKTFGNYFVVKLNGNIVFVKKALGVQAKDTVKIQIQKSTKNFALAKIFEISPISTREKKLMVKQTLQKMMKSSMHFGEKAIRCSANMRKYIWYRKKNSRIYTNSQKIYLNTLIGFSHADRIPDPTNDQHPSALMNTGVHFAQPQQNALWSPKHINEFQRPMVKRGRHVLNVMKTQRCFEQALKQLAKYAIKGKTFLFVGTKKPAASLIAKTALLTKTSFFVNTRWLGGMLTNWKTILKSISQIRPILKQKQKILQKVLEKRQKIQRRLLNKVFLLRKKSKQFMMKGKYLIQQILVEKNFLIERSQQLMQKKNAILFSNMALLNAAKSLKSKKNQILKQIQQLELAATEILKKKKQVKSLLTVNIATFDEIEQFFEIGKQLVKTKNLLEKNGEKKFLTISYEKFLTAKNLQNSLQSSCQIPNPSPEIFQKIISVLSNLRKTGLFETKHENIDVSVALNRPKSTSDTSISENTGVVENQTILLSKFLNKFIAFLPFFKNSLQTLSSRLIQQQKMLQELNLKLYKISESQKLLKQLYKKTVSQLSIVFEKFITQRNNFKNFGKILKQLASEQRLLKFLPRLRYLPTSQMKIYETVELFMKKFVDPKLSYPMEQIYNQKLKFTSKKIAATRKQKWQRLEKYFGGITKMAKMNTKQISKNVAIIIGQQEEMNAIHECRKLGMKIFAVVDTNCNPKYVDHIIPANDDSRNSIKYILGEMLTYIRLGQKLRQKVSLRAKFQQKKTF